MSVRPAPCPAPRHGTHPRGRAGRGTFRGHGNLHFQSTAERSWEGPTFKSHGLLTRMLNADTRGRFNRALVRIERKLKSQLVTNTAER